MTTITANDLLYRDYTWTALPGDDPRRTGAPDSVLLNRHEGYEVLYFINRFCAGNTWNPGPAATKATAQKVERLIRLHLPSTVRSREGIWQWLLQNWQIHI